MICLYLDPQGEKVFSQSGAAAAPNTSHALTNNSVDQKESSEEIIFNLRKRVKELEGKLNETELGIISIALYSIILGIFLDERKESCAEAILSKKILLKVIDTNYAFSRLTP